MTPTYPELLLRCLEVLLGLFSSDWAWVEERTRSELGSMTCVDCVALDLPPHAYRRFHEAVTEQPRVGREPASSTAKAEAVGPGARSWVDSTCCEPTRGGSV
jgi:hypothetical protein